MNCSNKALSTLATGDYSRRKRRQIAVFGDKAIISAIILAYSGEYNLRPRRLGDKLSPFPATRQCGRGLNARKNYAETV